MEINITRTIEYVIDVDDTDEEALAAINGLLVDNGVEGDSLYERVQTLFNTDVHDALAALCKSNLVDVAADSYTTDSWDGDGLTTRWGGELDDDDAQDEPITRPLTLPGFVTGEGFVSASLT
jgi:hypothetical protein